LRLSANLVGAPALTLQEFAAYRQDLIVGVSIQLGVPASQYDSTRLLNIGTNRWSVKPDIGSSKAIGNWTIEGDPGRPARLDQVRGEQRRLGADRQRFRPDRGRLAVPLGPGLVSVRQAPRLGG
jgi:hypothetical protein